MLSKKYLFIKSLLTQVSKIKGLNRKLLILANIYLDINKGFRFSYISDENGETDLIDKLKFIYSDRPLTFFDVGAHVGTYTDIVMNRFSNYTGYLFDLSKSTLDICIERHGSNKNLNFNHLALSDTIGDVEYRFYPKTQMQSGISGVGPFVGLDFELRTAPCTTGDQYCVDQKIDHIDLLKIDTEGYDLHVLRGFDQMLAGGRIDIIQFEYNIKSGETHSMLGDFYAYLAKHGYAVGVLRPTGVEFRPFEFKHNDFDLGPNYVACLPRFRETLSAFK